MTHPVPNEPNVTKNKPMKPYPLFTRPLKSNLDEAAAQLSDLTGCDYTLSWSEGKLTLTTGGEPCSPPFTKKEMAAFLIASLTCLTQSKP